jgi:hypothetical protein
MMDNETIEKKEKDNVTLVELKKVYDTSNKLAREIRMLSRAFKKIADCGLERETIVLLLWNSSGVGKPAIRSVMKALEELEWQYLKGA